MYKVGSSSNVNGSISQELIEVAQKGGREGGRKGKYGKRDGWREVEGEGTSRESRERAGGGKKKLQEEREGGDFEMEEKSRTG